MPNEQIPQLVADLRHAMDELYTGTLPPLPPPATRAELNAAGRELGRSLPADVKDLYSVARSGRIGIFNIIPIDQVASITKEQLISLERDLAWEPGMDPDHWDGEIPEGDLLALSWSPPTVIFYECNGPLTDRLVEFLFQGVGDVWGRLGRSLEDCLRWQLAAFNIGAFTVRTFPHDDTGIIVDLATDIDREDLLDKLRPHLAASGATPAYFGVYDPPPGYTSPGR